MQASQPEPSQLNAKSPRKRAPDITREPSLRSPKKGRPRRACDPCNKSKVKCDGSQKPCPRCAKRGKPEECVTSEDVVEDFKHKMTEEKVYIPYVPVLPPPPPLTLPPIPALVIPAIHVTASSQDVIDLTDLLEEQMKKFPMSPEKWKRMIIDRPLKW
jgi:hypothetical protein